MDDGLNCIKTIYYRLLIRFPFLRKKYTYEKENIKLVFNELNVGEIEILLDDANVFTTIGYSTIIQINNHREMSFVLYLEGKRTDGSTFGYKGKGVSKGVYNYIITNYRPDSFESIYAEDNKRIFLNYYRDIEQDVRKACEQTPNGKVVSKRGYSFNEFRSRFTPPDHVRVVWDRIKCKFI